MHTLARYYRIAIPEAHTVDDYFRQLQFFALEIVNEAAERSPGAHPSFFPRVGELIAICQNVVEEIREANKREQGDSRQTWNSMGKCEHVYRDEPEPEGGLITSFLVCVHCRKAKPVFSREMRFSNQKAYLAQAITAR